MTAGQQGSGAGGRELNGRRIGWLDEPPRRPAAPLYNNPYPHLSFRT
jgi:hypothetical protein